MPENPLASPWRTFGICLIGGFILMFGIPAATRLLVHRPSQRQPSQLPSATPPANEPLRIPTTPLTREAIEKFKGHLTPVMRPDGFVTKESHSQFWFFIESLDVNSHDYPRLQQYLKEIFHSGIEYRKEMWKSISMTASSGSVVKTPSLPRSLEKMGESLRLEMPQADVELAMAHARTRLDAYLNAAVTGSPLETPAGTIYITQDVADEELLGIEAVSERLDILLDEQWTGNRKEYRYPAARIRILSLYGFLVSKDVFEDGDDKFDIWQLTQSVDDNLMILITSMPFSQGGLPPPISTEDLLHSTFKELGILAPTVEVATWRSLESAMGYGQTADLEGDLFIAARVVGIPSPPTIHLLSTLSRVSRLHAVQALTDLEGSVQFYGQ